MAGFITPHFELSQNGTFVIVAIRLPTLRSTEEGEFYVLDREFKFHLKPYFLRLTFRQSLVEDGRERAEHDIASGVLRVWLPKAVPGEHFAGLDMLTELLRKPDKPRGPLIEVVGSSASGDGGADGSGGGGGDSGDSGDGMSGDEFQVDQELPSLATCGSAAAYGFNGAYSGVFTGLAGEGLVLNDGDDPEVAATPMERRAARLEAEDKAFDAEHYMADYMDDAGAKEAVRYVPWWRGDEAQAWAEQDATGEGQAAAEGDASSSSTATTTTAAAAASAVSAASAAAGASPRPSAFTMGSELQQALLSLPRKEFLLSADGRRRALYGLFDVLFAYCYDVRTTEGEATVESGWTIRRLSSQLSYLDSAFESAVDAAIACTRRSLCYPLIRNFGLSAAVVKDVACLLKLGRPAVLRALLEARASVQRNGEYGYLLNRIWLDDYCVWIQQVTRKRLSTL